MKVRLWWTDLDGELCEKLSGEVTCKGEGINQWAAEHLLEVAADIWPRGVTVVTCCAVDLDCPDFTSTCEHCGADYNSAGQRLAPRAQWGEETGENWLDCY